MVAGVGVWVLLHGFGVGRLCFHHQFGAALCFGIVGDWEVLDEALCGL